MMDIIAIQEKLKHYNDSKKSFIGNIERLKNEQTKYNAQLDLYENSLRTTKNALLKEFNNAGILIKNIDDMDEIDAAMAEITKALARLDYEITSYNAEITNLLLR